MGFAHSEAPQQEAPEALDPDQIRNKIIISGTFWMVLFGRVKILHDPQKQMAAVGVDCRMRESCIGGFTVY